MARKQSKRPAAKKKGGAVKKDPAPSPALRAGFALIILLGLVAAAVFLADRYIPKAGPPPKTVKTAKAAPLPVLTPRKEPVRTAQEKPAETGAKKPVYEVFPPPDKAPPPGKAAPGKYRVAIVIDDLGYDEDLAERFLALDYPITVSVLPDAPHSEAIARRARQLGKQVLLHLPMEPREYPQADPGPGALLSSMSTDEMLAVFEDDLRSVPFAQGVNNHMGSRLSREESVLNPLFTALKARGLFFLDSMTAPGGEARAAARMLRLPFAQRDVFLDHEQTREFIEGQLDRLLGIAGKKGSAIGIGHPHEITYQVLREKLPDLSQKASLTPVSELTEIVE
ncbi:MAG: divergent polysaccharide deacetylase family protein [Thermodesulfobacteriota bacterium]